MKPTLVILAAGMASRYGSMKQVEAFGPSGETIMDYSISDAIKAGFGKVVFIIRKQFEENFRTLFANKLSKYVDVEFAFQELDMFLDGLTIPEERTKPWGTAHAVLCTKDAVKEPFGVINADDFYGFDAFKKAYEFLTTACDTKTYAVIGYPLNNTLSEHGTVNRGVCETDSNQNLTGVVERLNIAENNGVVESTDGLEPKTLSKDAYVSMNFWCFHPSYYEFCESEFKKFITESINVPKSEALIPAVVDTFIKEGGSVKVIPTSAQWFGVTYKEDAPAVQKQLNELIAKGEYPSQLWS
ncbi:MAG: sugar phosphate nucleotidyltransferase [Niabella sp.]